MNCTKCGYENREDADFCVNCGNKLNKQEHHEYTGNIETTKVSFTKENKNRIILLTSIIAVVILVGTFLTLYFTHVICFHDWKEATCTEPKTCTICNRTEGEPLGHILSEATCTEDAVCERCGFVAEKAFGHKWSAVSCTEDSVCTVCGAIGEKATGHKWLDATCTEPKTCEVCGETEGEPLGHDWADATYDAPMTCKRCGETKGKAMERPDIAGYWAQENLNDYNHVYGMDITDNGNGYYSVEIMLTWGASSAGIDRFEGHMESDGVIYYEDGISIERTYLSGGGSSDRVIGTHNGTIEIYGGCLYWTCDSFSSGNEVKFIRTNNR